MRAGGVLGLRWRRPRGGAVTAPAARLITAAGLVALTVLVIGWDLYANSLDPSDSSATVSRVVLTWAQHHPALPFGLGYVLGHLTWPQPSQEATS